MATNVQSVCASFCVELLEGYHAFGSAYRTADTFKAALYLQNEGLGQSSSEYVTGGEVTGTGYAAGGKTITNANAPANGTTGGYWTPSANLQWTGLTLASDFDCWMLYNSSQGNRAVAVFTFAAETVSAGTFTITMPANAVSTALLQVS